MRSRGAFGSARPACSSRQARACSAWTKSRPRDGAAWPAVTGPAGPGSARAPSWAGSERLLRPASPGGPISPDTMPSGMPPRSAKLAASILSADLARLADQVKAVEADLDMVHVDNMDAHFVPPLCLGAVVVASLRQATELPLHCHLMVERPVEMLRDFSEAGADIVSMHVEAADEPERAVKEAAAQGLLAGLAVSPQTPVETVYPFLEDLDRVLVMSVRPGWSGQAFIESALPKIEAVRSEIDRRGLQ